LLHSCKRPRWPYWFGIPAQITHSVLTQHFYVKEQISAASLPVQILVITFMSKRLTKLQQSVG